MCVFIMFFLFCNLFLFLARNLSDNSIFASLILYEWRIMAFLKLLSCKNKLFFFFDK
jgi:hypothetical protein